MGRAMRVAENKRGWWGDRTSWVEWAANAQAQRPERGLQAQQALLCEGGYTGGPRPYLDIPKDHANARLRNCSVRF